MGENEAERLKAELALVVRSVSHDLRQPLHVISGYIELLSYRYRDTLDAKGGQLLDKALDGVARMNQMIDALVGLARLDAASPWEDAVRCEALFDQVLTELGPAIAATGARIERGPLPVVAGRPALLSQLFEQLVSNVLRFPAQGAAPRGRLDARGEPGFWRFALRDEGPGLDPRLHTSIFEPFGRGLDPRAGTGMGLTLCRKIAELHGGSIGVESQVGAGATFWFTLPR